MTTIRLLHIGGGKEKDFLDAENEYKKRLNRFCRYETVELREERIAEENASPEQIKKALSSEAERIRQSFQPRSYKIALCIEGKQVSSEEFSTLLIDKTLTHPTIEFVIGSSHGLDNGLKKECDFLLSFSKMTFPHRLARVLLAEQLYRAYSIAGNGKYHK